MAIVVVIMAVIIIALIMYIVIFQRQVKVMKLQLDRRLNENIHRPVSLELFNRNLSGLAVNINKCLKMEETLRLNSIRDERKFKELIANISHDLRTPLTAIKGYLQLMEKGGLSDSQQKKLAIAQKHAEELGSLIQHFFEYSYLLNAETILSIKKLNLTNLVTGCIAESVAVLEEKGLSVYMEENPPVFAFADNEMTVRIVQNLIRNCAVHSAGDIEVRIVPENDKYAVISFKNPVNDASQIDADRLFERFYTADKSRNKSTGIGLSIVKLLAEQMGGNTEAILKDGYLEICVRLPLCKKG